MRLLLKTMIGLGLMIPILPFDVSAESATATTSKPSIKIYHPGDFSFLPNRSIATVKIALAKRNQLIKSIKIPSPAAPLSQAERARLFGEIYQAMLAAGVPGLRPNLPLCSPCSPPVTLTPANPGGQLGSTNIYVGFAGGILVNSEPPPWAIIPPQSQSNPIASFASVIINFPSPPQTPVQIDVSLQANSTLYVFADTFQGPVTAMNGHVLILSTGHDYGISIYSLDSEFTFYSATFAQM
jgi:hypothetical protein